MKIWLWIALVVALVSVAVLAGTRPGLFPGNLDVPHLIWLIMALMLVSGAGTGFWRLRREGGRALAGIVFWGVLIVALALAYPFFS